MHDLSAHNFLALRVRLRGSKRTRNSYFVNIQTDGYVTTDLWQHRLYFQRDDGEWEDVYVRLLLVRHFSSSPTIMI
jgi:NADH dehydrogenase [ubiquinone] 1 alpha subcomplex assembly factor 1